MYCKFCGKKIESNQAFCSSCGNSVSQTKGADIPTPTNLQNGENVELYNSSGNKISFSYVVSAISAMICFVIRMSLQEMYYTYESIMRNERVYGIDPDTKPLFTIIPGIATIVSALLIASDRSSDSQKKMTAFIIDAVIIALAILFIWFDIPYDLFDF